MVVVTGKHDRPTHQPNPDLSIQNAELMWQEWGVNIYKDLIFYNQFLTLEMDWKQRDQLSSGKTSNSKANGEEQGSPREEVRALRGENSESHNESRGS